MAKVDGDVNKKKLDDNCPAFMENTSSALNVDGNVIVGASISFRELIWGDNKARRYETLKDKLERRAYEYIKRSILNEKTEDTGWQREILFVHYKQRLLAQKQMMLMLIPGGSKQVPLLTIK